jgi:hypothetical protein
MEQPLDDSRRLSAAAAATATASSLDFNNDDECSTNVNNGSAANRNSSASYSSMYKLIKNSQSSLMPNANKSVIDQPLLLAPVANLSKQHHQDDLQSQQNTCGGSMQQMQSKFANFNLSQQQMQFKKELDAKLSGPCEQNGYQELEEDDNLKQNINLK